jgi:hypothetical protein
MMMMMVLHVKKLMMRFRGTTSRWSESTNPCRCLWSLRLLVLLSNVLLNICGCWHWLLYPLLISTRRWIGATVQCCCPIEFDSCQQVLKCLVLLVQQRQMVRVLLRWLSVVRNGYGAAALNICRCLCDCRWDSTSLRVVLGWGPTRLATSSSQSSSSRKVLRNWKLAAHVNECLFLNI